MTTTGNLDLVEQSLTPQDLSCSGPDAVAAGQSGPAIDQSLGSILFICTGNIGRSAYMELSARHRLNGLGIAEFTLASAGTRAVVGAGVHQHVAEHLSRSGVHTEDFRSQQLTTSLLQQADLVITATREQRTMAGRLAPGHRNTMFTLRQLHRLLSVETDSKFLPAATDTPAAALAVKANRNRGRSGIQLRHDDIADPIGGGSRTFAAAFTAIDGPLTAVLHELAELYRLLLTQCEADEAASAGENLTAPGEEPE